MKRRNLVMASAGMAGALIPGLGRAAQPCPPPLVSVSGGSSASTTCPNGTTYSTTFSLNENPISDGGVWTHNPSNIWQKIQTTGGNAIAANYTEDVDDAYAYLGNWPTNDYDIVATVLYGGLNAGEAELLLRVSDSPTSVRAYEFLYNTAGSWQLVRWNGPHNDYTVIHPGGGTPGAGNGAQIRATIVGTKISLFWRASASAGSWATLLSNFTDPGTSGAPISTGKPGMAIYVHASSGNRGYIGFQDYSVTAL